MHKKNRELFEILTKTLYTVFTPRTNGEQCLDQESQVSTQYLFKVVIDAEISFVEHAQ